MFWALCAADLDDVVFLQQLFNIGVLDLAEGFFEGYLLDEGEFHVGGLFAIAELNGGVQQVADIVDAAPDLRDAAVNVQKRSLQRRQARPSGGRHRRAA